MAAENRPNILFFFPDQHRADWLGSFHRLPLKTPNLDRLAAEGVLFNDCVTPSPLCAPARACLAAGKEYDRCRTPSNGENFPLDETTVYALLRNGGYHVMGCGKFDLAKALHDWDLHGKRRLDEWGFSDGIDNEGKWDGINSGRDTAKGPYMHYLEQKQLKDVHVQDFDRRRKTGKDATFPTPLPEEAYCDNWVAQNGLDLLRRAPAERPWFLQVNFTGPHDPWDITGSMLDAVRGRTGFPPPVQNEQFDPETHRRIRRNYAAMIENIDRWIGRYCTFLEETGQRENTLIVYSSDHGEMLGDHGQWGKSCAYHGAVGVPLIIAGPGVRSGQTCRAPATILDLAATFLDWANLPVPRDMDSISLKPILAGTTDRSRTVVQSGLDSWRAVYDGRYKLIRGRNGQKAPDRRGPFRLYDRENDPGETRNVAGDHPEIVRRLAPLLPAEGQRPNPETPEATPATPGKPGT